MRPVRLELKGFGAFRAQTVVDFDGVDLAAFVGSTGAGKSTIIDGIVFALYGSVARYRKANLVAPVINQLAAEARVRLDFTVGEVSYTAVRIVRRTAKGATTKEARLESGGEVLAGGAGELDDKVEDLLGLDFDQFNKTAVLPQGDFARFLTESSSDRQALLRRLLGIELYRTMGTKARERAKIADSKRSALSDQLRRTEPTTDDQLEDLRQRAEWLTDVASELGPTLEAAERAALEHRASETALASIDGQLKALDAISMPPAVARFSSAVDAVDANIELLRARVDDLERQLAGVTTDLESSPDLADLERVASLLVRANELSRTQSDLRLALVEQAGALEAAEARAAAADDELVAATTSLNEARLAAGAAGLAAELTVGDACPVCRQTVVELPEHAAHAGRSALEELTGSAAEARSAADVARAELAASTGAHAAAKAALEAHVELVAENARLLLEAGAPDPDAVAEQMHAVTAMLSSRDATRAELAETRRTIDAAQRERNDLDDKALELRRELIVRRDEVATLDPPAPSGASIADDWRELVAWAKQTSRESLDRQEVQAAALLDARRELDSVRDQICELLAPILDGSPLPDDPASFLAVETARNEAAIASLEERRRERRRLTEVVAELDSEHAVAAELGRHLGSSGFEQWLMADVMSGLAQQASARLHELSGGAYSLVTDGSEFSIRDHRNADETRSTRTLSGGETFLTSLSLALALADNISSLGVEGPAQIESMFLDEGFGTLDSETLDVVAAAIEELGARGRMVGIVTHIRELADRMPVRFEVERTSSTAGVTRSDH